MTHALIALVRTQLQLYLKNRKALITHLLMPILIAAFFGSLFGDSGAKETARLKVAWVDEDGSALSQRIGLQLQQDGKLAVLAMTRAEAEAAVRKGERRAAVLMPAGFGTRASRWWDRHELPEVQLWYDPSESMSAQILEGLLAQHAMRETLSQGFGHGQAGAGLATVESEIEGSDLPAARREQLKALARTVNDLQTPQPGEAPASGAAAAAGSPGEVLSLPYALKTQALSAGQAGYNSYAHSFSGMGVQFVLMLGVELGVGLLMARRSGMWQRLRAAPLSKGLLLGSHFLSIWIIASAVLLVVLAAGMAVFGFRVQGSLPGFVLVVLGMGAFTAGFGLALAALGGSPETTRGLAIMASLMLVMLGGAWVPSFVFPAWLQDLTLWVPLRWAVDGLDAMTWRGQGLATALLAAAVLFGSALLLTGLAIWRFRWRE
ncbi:ABC transporter permease [Mitsuaria sp. WAJ17]|uniref:ABC transporter permease n=1 Tax=Mitsuaria sp. WAJ17 TaxID=2761452 RepID=UPI0016031651|nr:ABC transporter permease [Mitsuaria sp. WAJ17]MBB2485758.1 ABC transporter permease [Mitsuaria sp. WAJ17]